MLKAISNTSPPLYLYRIGGIEWLPKLFTEVKQRILKLADELSLGVSTKKIKVEQVSVDPKWFSGL